MDHARFSTSTFLTCILVTIAILIGLGETYQYLIKQSNLKPWQSVLIAHILLGIFVYAIRKPARQSFKLAGTPMMAWTPGLLVIVGAFGLALLGERSGNVRPYAFSGSSEIIYVLSTLTVIPLAEELVFRMGITPFISRFSGARWGPWYSAIIFSVAHTNPTLARWIGLKIGLPIGPFLLAICCDLIVRRWGRIWPATVFHAACNATVYIFGWINPSWLMKLDGLYM